MDSKSELQFLYHFRPLELQGSKLIPLNDLRHIYPNVYQNEAKKYKGREWLTKKQIPILECLWNDVLHLSPINPQVVLDCWKSQGIFDYARKKGKEFRVFRVPATAINWKTTVCYQSFNFDYSNFDPSKEKYWRISPETYIEQTEVESSQIEVWKADIEAGRKFFWYSHTRHILCRQTIDLEGLEEIVCK